MGRRGIYSVNHFDPFAPPKSPKESTTDTDSLEFAQCRKEYHNNDDGVCWIICALLIVGQMAGGGLVALPKSMVDAGLIGGIILTLVSALASGYTGVQLGDNWIIMQDRWPEYRNVCRKPFPEMGYRAVGPIGRALTSALIAVQQFGLAVVFLLLSAQNIASFLYAFFEISTSFCFIVVIVAAVLLPFLMLGSPKDFWQAAIIASVSTSCAVVLIIVGIAHDQPTCGQQAEYGSVKFDKFFLAYGTIMFAYGGHSGFPTFQHDMKKPYEFKKSVILGYALVVLMYLPVTIYGFLVYGDALGSSVIDSIQTKWVQQAANVLITIHVSFTQIIIISPLTLEIESWCNIPNRFSVSRFILRTIILICIVFVALTIPKFGVILDLIGGTTITCMTMLLPGIFNMFIRAAQEKRNMKLATGEARMDSVDAERASIADVLHFTPKWMLALNLGIIAFGLIGGIAATISAITQIVNASFDTPCYVQVFYGFKNAASAGKVNCCGLFKNITTNGQIYDDFCAIPSS